MTRIIRYKRKISLMERMNSRWLCLVVVALFVWLAVASLHNADGGYSADTVSSHGELIDRNMYESREVALIMELYGNEENE